MADKLAEAEKSRDKAEKDFDDAQSALEKAVKKCLALTNPDKKVAALKHLHTLLREAVDAGESYLTAEEAVEKAEKTAAK